MKAKKCVGPNCPDWTPTSYKQILKEKLFVGITSKSQLLKDVGEAWGVHEVYVNDHSMWIFPDKENGSVLIKFLKIRKKVTKIKLFQLIYKIFLVKLTNPPITFAVNESMFLGKMYNMI